MDKLKSPPISTAKRVLYITYDGLTEPLGQSQIVPYLKGLSANNVSYYVLSFEKPVSGYGPKCLILEKELASFSINWKRLKYHKRISVLATAFDIFQGISNSFWLVKSNRIKIVHARSYVSSMIAVILAKLCGLKFIFDMRGFWAEERVEAGIWEKDSLLYKLAKFFEKIFLRNADTVVVLTMAAKDEIEKVYLNRNGKKNVVCVPTCVDLVRFTLGRPVAPKGGKDSPVEYDLVYSGAVSTWSMPEKILEFCSVFMSCKNNSRFLILTKEDKLFEKNILKSGLNKDYFSVLSLDYRQMPQYLASCQAGVAFYKPGYSRKGCCPTKVGEYLACGLPVIINSGIGDNDEIIKNEGVGVVIDEFSDEAYRFAIDKIASLLRDGMELRKRCRLAAERYFSLNTGIKKYLHIYGQLQ